MKWVQTEITLTQIDRARRDASNGPGPVKYGQHMDEIGRNYKIEEVKSDPSGIRSDCVKRMLYESPSGNLVDGLPLAWSYGSIVVSPPSNPGLICNFEGLFGLVLEIPFIESHQRLLHRSWDFGLSIADSPSTWLYPQMLHHLACGMLRRTVWCFLKKWEFKENEKRTWIRWR